MFLFYSRVTHFFNVISTCGMPAVIVWSQNIKYVLFQLKKKNYMLRQLQPALKQTLRNTGKIIYTFSITSCRQRGNSLWQWWVNSMKLEALKWIFTSYTPSLKELPLQCYELVSNQKKILFFLRAMYT